MAERLYVSNKNETVRMFESDFMELFSRVHPATPLVLYLPVVAYMLYISIWQHQLSIAAVAALFLLGILLWTLLEYLIHRYVFHYEPKTRVGKRLHYIIHGVHHDYPNDAWSVPSNFRASGVERLCRVGFWLRLLRHAPLRDASFSHEARGVALAEAVSSSPSLQG